METVIDTDVREAASWLQRGQLCAIPTETVYGLAANALDADAVIRIFDVKQRPTFDPLIVHIASIQALDQLTHSVSKKAMMLAEHFWPGPLTLVLQKNKIIPDIVTSGLETVGIRIPSHPMTLELLRTLDLPLAAPSANPFGYISPTTPQHVYDQLSGKIPYILDGGNCSVGVESTIVQCDETGCTVLRLGGISIESIEEVAGDVKVMTESSSNPGAPGMLSSHYSPRKKMILGNPVELMQQFPNLPAGVLSFSEAYPYSNLRILSPKGDLNEAAKNLYDHMRQLDQSACDVIFAETVPDIGLGRAINDRLRRAAFGN